MLRYLVQFPRAVLRLNRPRAPWGGLFHLANLNSPIVLPLPPYLAYGTTPHISTLPYI
eukprot:Ihof_evm3s596 gene=Ihof_evmTU3s596